jgi:predicted methyltransferase
MIALPYPSPLALTRRGLLAGGAALAALPAFAQAGGLAELVAHARRSAGNRARDPYRHPLETLTFLGVAPDSVVVEILPGGAGYWTEILAPYLKDHGRYIAANAPKDTESGEMQRENAAFLAKVAADPAAYGKVEITEFKADRYPIAPAGSADFVLTFRNIHNWMAAGEVEQCFAAFHKALKPGGALGVEEHRGRADQPQDPLAKSGYVRQDVAIAMAEKAGFRLVASSEINANPRDTKDYPAGVWTLPPTYRLKDQDRATYTTIGESDRFLLKFVKVGA